MTPTELQQHPDYYVHHTAKHAGYVPRTCDGIVEPYRGRFGRGYVLKEPRWDTSRFVTVTYYIRKDNKEDFNGLRR